jgi:hypothetical protein
MAGNHFGTLGKNDLTRVPTALGLATFPSEIDAPPRTASTESFCRTLLMKWTRSHVPAKDDDRSRAHDPWLWGRNDARPHGSLGGRLLVSRASPTLPSATPSS